MNIENPNQNEKFSAKEMINGLEIDCHWNESISEYVLSFPLNEETKKHDRSAHFNEVFCVGDTANEAKKYFEYIKDLAKMKKRKEMLEIYLKFLEEIGKYINIKTEPQ